MLHSKNWNIWEKHSTVSLLTLCSKEVQRCISLRFGYFSIWEGQRCISEVPYVKRDAVLPLSDTDCEQRCSTAPLKYPKWTEMQHCASLLHQVNKATALCFYGSFNFYIATWKILEMIHRNFPEYRTEKGNLKFLLDLKSWMLRALIWNCMIKNTRRKTGHVSASPRSTRSAQKVYTLSHSPNGSFTIAVYTLLHLLTPLHLHSPCHYSV